MNSMSRLRAYAGLWTVVALIGVATGFVATTAGPATTRIADHALRQALSEAAYVERDLTSVRAARPALMGTPQATPEGLQDQVLATLPPQLGRAVETTWAYQFTSMSPFEGVGAALTGDGVVSFPDGFGPVVSFHHQPGLEEEITLVDGQPPTTDPDGDLIEVMVATAVADRLGLQVGGEYSLHPGSMTEFPDQEPSPSSLTVRLSGIFTADDPDAPAWDHASQLLAASTTTIPGDNPPPATLRAALVTDEATFLLLHNRGLTARFEPATGVRVRLDPEQLDSAWVPDGIVAVAQWHTATGSQLELDQQTGLPALLRAFQQQEIAVRAVVAVAAAGIVATLLGLLLLAARLTVERRRDELELLRARGGSVATAAGRLAAEAAWLAPLAAGAGWGLHVLVMGDPAQQLGALAAAAGVAFAAMLVVPVAGALVAARSGGVVARRDIGHRRASPARLTAELSVVVLAVLGVVLMHQRGLSAAGVDPYLSAVPVLVAVAAGLLAMRFLAWPLRALAAGARRSPGVIGFVGLARAGRAAPAAALALLVLVIAVAVGGFAGAVNSGVAQARDAVAVEAVGAHVRVAGEQMPVEVVAAAAQAPGVTAVAAGSRGGALYDEAARSRGSALQGIQVLVVDMDRYREVLAALDGADHLPPELVTAGPDTDPVPVLASGSVAQRHDLTARIGEHELSLAVVGDAAALPGVDRERAWVVIPRQALPDPGPVDELLVAGAAADPRQVGDAVAGVTHGGDLTVSSVAGFRQQLETSGFNDGLTLVFVVGTVGGAAGGVLAVALALVVQARARGRVLSVLRTMGLSSGQARGLLLVELLPVASVAVLVGAVVGVVLPLVLAPALGLDAFTAGQPLPIGIDPTIAAGFAGIVALLLLAGTVLETWINRRLSLGGVLRVD